VTRATLIARSLWHYRRTHFGALLAGAIATAVLTGALVVGDSVRYTLTSQALERLGNTELAIASGDRFFRDDLPARLGAQLHSQAAVIAQGVAIHNDSNSRLPRVQVLGVREEFWRTGANGPLTHPRPGDVVLNQPLASALGAKAGDTIRLRMARPELLPRDAPLGTDKEAAAVVRARVSAIIPERGIGRFSLQASQVAPYSAFVPLEDLQTALKQKGRANLLLVPRIEPPSAGHVLEDSATKALENAWTLDDAQLKVRLDPVLGFAELSTPRVFLDDRSAERLAAKGWRGLTTYFVNSIRANGNATPYSMLTAAPPPLVAEGFASEGITLNQWTVEDLKAKEGDAVEIEYYVLGLGRKLETRKANFVLRKTVPLEGLFADRNLMPEFPGIADVDTTHDWDAGIPIDMKKIRDKDEDYWKKHRGTPKAFIPIERGRELFSNRFGTYTAMRKQIDAGTDKGAIEREILSTLNPADAGLAFQPVRALALNAASHALDFGQLFIGFSFFLVIAALLLMALVFQFGIESRGAEIGVLLATGWTSNSVRKLLLLEGACLALIGAIIGGPLGLYYARWLLWALSSRWVEAVGTRTLLFHAEPASVAIGVVASWLCAVVAMFWALRTLTRRTARELLSRSDLATNSSPPRQRLCFGIGSALLAAGALVAAFFLLNENLSAAPAFFGAGAMLLAGALLLTRWLLGRSNAEVVSDGTSGARGLWNLGVRSAGRKAGRSIATVSLLACGVFLIVAVAANQQDASVNAAERSSGTGGFALYAETTLPVLYNLNTSAGRESAGVTEDALAGATLYAFRVHEGDDASCLNLNRAQRPRILGASDTFLRRNGFQFVASLMKDGAAATNPWQQHLNRGTESSTIPAVCDIQSLTWALGKKVGDILEIPDEQGVTRKIRIVGAIASSVLQGSLIVSEADFVRLFPSESGYRMFLIDAGADRAASLTTDLRRALQDEGLDIISAQKRLAAFNAVQNTYLDTFRAIGGLGLLLGSFGIGLVVLRNMLERRRELAVLRAFGFSRLQLGWMIFGEHLWLVLLAIICGVGAAGVAILPALRFTSTPLPWGSLIATVAAVAACAIISALLATSWVVRAPLLPALREE